MIAALAQDRFSGVTLSYARQCRQNAGRNSGGVGHGSPHKLLAARSATIAADPREQRHLALITALDRPLDRRIPRGRQLVLESVGYRLDLRGVVVIKHPPDLSEQVSVLVSAVNAHCGKQLPGIAFLRVLLTDIQRQPTADDQGIDMRFQPLLEIPDPRPGDFGIAQQCLALLVQERGLLEMLVVHPNSKIAW